MGVCCGFKDSVAPFVPRIGAPFVLRTFPPRAGATLPAPGIPCEIRFALSRPLTLCEGDGLSPFDLPVEKRRGLPFDFVGV